MSNGWIPAGVFTPKTNSLVMVIVANRDPDLENSESDYRFCFGWYEENNQTEYGPWHIEDDSFFDEFEIVIAWRPVPTKPNLEVLKEWRQISMTTNETQ